LEGIEHLFFFCPTKMGEGKIKTRDKKLSKKPIGVCVYLIDDSESPLQFKNVKRPERNERG